MSHYLLIKDHSFFLVLSKRTINKLLCSFNHKSSLFVGVLIKFVAVKVCSHVNALTVSWPASSCF